MIRNFVFIDCHKFPVTYVVKVGSGKADRFRLDCIERKQRTQKGCEFFFEPLTQSYDDLLLSDLRILASRRYCTLEVLYNSIFKSPCCYQPNYLLKNSTV